MKWPNSISQANMSRRFNQMYLQSSHQLFQSSLDYYDDNQLIPAERELLMWLGCRQRCVDHWGVVIQQEGSRGRTSIIYEKLENGESSEGILFSDWWLGQTGRYTIRTINIGMIQIKRHPIRSRYNKFFTKAKSIWQKSNIQRPCNSRDIKGVKVGRDTHVQLSI